MTRPFQILVVAAYLAVAPQTLGLRLSPTGSTPADLLTGSDIVFQGYFRIPGGGSTGSAPHETPAVAVRRVGGVNHLLISQLSSDPSHVAPYSPVELADPGSYNSDWTIAPTATLVTNWGVGASSAYDPYHGLYGMTYNSSGTLIQDGGCQYCDLPIGAGWHQVTSTCCYYMSYGLPYGTPPEPLTFTTLVVDLTAQGNTTVSGPYRMCVGTDTYGGSQSCGAGIRYGQFTELPDGSMGVVQGSQHIQNSGKPNSGPSLWGGLPWLTLSTPAGFGSVRGGNPNHRTTDLIPPDDYLSHYQLHEVTDVNLDGTLNVPAWSFRRPSFSSATLGPGSSFSNYTYQAGLAYEYALVSGGYQTFADPDEYGGTGTWVDNGDSLGGLHYVGGTKRGVIATGALAFGPVWYKTRAGREFSYKGTQSPHIVFQRSVDEAWSSTGFYWSNGANLNADVRFDVKPAFYTSVLANAVYVKYANDGASQSLSCTASGHVITVHLATNGSSVITSTANDVISKVNSTSACSTLVTASVSKVIEGSNDGSGVIPGLITKDDVPYDVTSNTLQLAGGAQNSPRENIDLGIPATGPVQYTEAAFWIYDFDSLKTTPDYAPNPTEFVYPKLTQGSFPCSINGTAGTQNCLVGSVYEPTSRTLYVISDKVDANGTLPLPVVGVYTIAGSNVPAPVPLPTRMLPVFYGVSALLTGLAFLGDWRRFRYGRRND